MAERLPETTTFIAGSDEEALDVARTHPYSVVQKGAFPGTYEITFAPVRRPEEKEAQERVA